jgi:anaerobic ribonucleoside-triphosphate reductase activating protein
MLLHAFVPASRANGPGLRAVVFFQGCRLHCTGCWNPQTHSFGGRDVPVQAVLARLFEALRREPLEGITFSGGEPMHQADAAAELMAKVRATDADLSLGMFSGYTEQELAQGIYFAGGISSRSHRASLWRQIRALLDFAVLGRYNQALPTREPLRTSRNQRLVLFSDRYQANSFGPQLIEVSIEASGGAVMTGFPILGSLD